MPSLWLGGCGCGCGGGCDRGCDRGSGRRKEDEAEDETSMTGADPSTSSVDGSESSYRPDPAAQIALAETPTLMDATAPTLVGLLDDDSDGSATVLSNGSDSHRGQTDYWRRQAIERQWQLDDLTGTTELRSQVPDFSLVQLVGRGGMGEVFEATQQVMNRSVAMKRLRHELVGHSRAEDLFTAEAAISARLDHPGIATAYQSGRDQDGVPFFIMRLIAGTSWQAEITQQSRDDFLTVLFRLCDALSFAHSKHFIHADIKPSNIMVGHFGEVLLMDWGVAVALGSDGTGQSRGGSPSHCSPEQAGAYGKRVDVRTDVYGVGAIIYQFVQGHAPRRGWVHREMLDLAAQGLYIDPSAEAQADRLLDIALRAMSANPDDRYASIEQLRQEVVAYRDRQAGFDLVDRATFFIRSRSKRGRLSGLAGGAPYYDKQSD